jgi:thiosulfate reductase cytochrome b subunit
MSSTTLSEDDAAARSGADVARKTIQPGWVRIMHWVNAVAMIVMITSGWQIYNASPLFDFRFSRSITLGGWLGGGLLWHFAAMWVLMLNGLLYLGFGVATGRFRRKLLPITPSGLAGDLAKAATFRLSHRDLTTYNYIQKLLYAGIILVGILVVLSGLSMWKPVQLHWLTALFGGYDTARYVHFFAMAAIVAFLVVHIALSVLVPRSLRAMIIGR